MNYTGLKVKSKKQLKIGEYPLPTFIPIGTAGIVAESYKSRAFGWQFVVKFDGFASPVRVEPEAVETVYP